MNLRNGKVTANRVIRCTAQRVASPGTHMPQSSLSENSDDNRTIILILTGMIQEYKDKYSTPYERLCGLREIYECMLEHRQILCSSAVLQEAYHKKSAQLLSEIGLIVSKNSESHVLTEAKNVSAKILEFLYGN